MGFSRRNCVIVKTQTVTARTLYIKWKDEIHFKIGVYAPKNGNTASIRKFKQKIVAVFHKFHLVHS